MGPTFIILFREVLEISIILSIIVAATRGIARRARWVWLGIAGGVIGSALVAILADKISQSLEGMGQEAFNAAILFVAVAMISWTVVWMQTHGRQIAQKMKQVGKDVQDGQLPLYAIAIVVSITMWREGAEIVLFMVGILSTTKESIFAIIAGGVGGGLVAATIGLLLYLGLIKISTKYMFAVSSWLLILVACGMSAQAAGYLTAADMLPALVPQLWDSSALLSENSLLGKMLHAMLGYTERPNFMQLLAYVATLLVIVTLLSFHKKGTSMNTMIKSSAVVLVLTLSAGLVLHPRSAQAYNVEKPYVEKGMMEVEAKNRFDFDSRSSRDNFRQHVLDLEYGLTDWWKIEAEGEWEKEHGDGYDYTATELENVFQFTQQGEYFVDVGAKLAYEFKHETGAADKVEGWLLLAKPVGRFTHVANIGLEKEVGDNSNGDAELEAKWMTQYNYIPLLNPGFEYYGEFGEVSDFNDWDDQKQLLGPVIYGDLAPGVKYELGWLFGLSDATQDHTLKLNLEYEFPVQF